MRQGVSGILITPSSTGGVLGAIKSARQQGVIVIALDTATEPENLVDATFATDNKEAGVLLGQYIKARMGQTPPQILMMDLDPSASVGIARHNGFLEGMGLPLDTPAIIGTALTQGDQSKAQRAMENLLQRAADRSTSSTTSTNPRHGAPTRPSPTPVSHPRCWWEPSTGVAQESPT